MTAPDLFTFRDAYPHAPGFRQGSDTSEAAADAIKPRMGRLQRLVLDALVEHGGMTPDECAESLDVDLLSIRPRFSELARLSIIVPTGERRVNKSGLLAKVFTVR